MIRDNLFEPIGHTQALELLMSGNKRYVDDRLEFSVDIVGDRKMLAQKGQAPFAAILGCSDSRVPPEVVFDVGIGQIFVIRTAGNVADASTIGSVEYAVDHLHTQLVLVMGHQKCGAVAAANSGGDYGPNIGAIISEIEPSLKKARSGMGAGDENDILRKCEDENVRHSAMRLAESAILKKHLDSGSLKIVCAKYNLDSGKVSII